MHDNEGSIEHKLSPSARKQQLTGHLERLVGWQAWMFQYQVARGPDLHRSKLSSQAFPKLSRFLGAGLGATQSHGGQVAGANGVHSQWDVTASLPR